MKNHSIKKVFFCIISCLLAFNAYAQVNTASNPKNVNNAVDQVDTGPQMDEMTTPQLQIMDKELMLYEKLKEKIRAMGPEQRQAIKDEVKRHRQTMYELVGDIGEYNSNQKPNGEVVGGSQDSLPASNVANQPNQNATGSSTNAAQGAPVQMPEMPKPPFNAR